MQNARGQAISNQKIKPLEAIVDAVQVLRGKSETVVHCHGVFDLLHIGHIKHLESASRLGHALVVTITPDHLVNKGPHRPVFTEQLRAEALAALQCVDYVAVNAWPTAVEAIGLLRPDFFVKGASDDPGPRDHTDSIVQEEAAVKACGGKFVLTNDKIFSATSIINRHTDVHSDEVRAYLDSFRQRYSEQDILDYLQRIRPLRILTIGETIIDEYCFCHVLNKANKDPILAAKFLYTERYLGGIQAINNHLSGFCDHLACLTALGAHGDEQAFIKERLANTISLHYVTKSNSPTIVKRRYVEEYLSTKLLEIDVMNDDMFVTTDEAAFLEQLEQLVPQHDLVIVADYGHGILTDGVIERVCALAPFLALNVQVNPSNYGFNLVSRYPKADFVVIDEPEARLEMKKKQLDIENIVHALATQLHCKSFLLTRGQNGTVGYDAAAGYSRTPVFSSKVVDRIGAGDACLAIAAPCAALAVPTEAIGFIGNVAGAAACAVIGNKSYLDPISYFRNISSLLR